MEENLLNNNSEKKSFYRGLLKLGVPIALQNLVTAILNIFDQVMVGWLPPEIADNALSAVLLANQLVFIFMMIWFSAGNTVNIFIARYTATGRDEEIPRRVGLVLVINTAVAIVLSLICFFAPEKVLSVFKPQAGYAQLAADFLKIVAISFIPMELSITLSFCARAVKKVRLPLIVNFIAVLMNIFFNYLFMFGMGNFEGMGLVGAAWGTVVSRTAECVMLLSAMIVKKYPILASPKRMFVRDHEFGKSFSKLFFPIVCNEMFWVISNALFLFVFDKLPDSQAVLAAVNIAQSVDRIVSVAMIGAGSALGVIIGNIIGEGDKSKITNSAKRGLLCGVVLGVAIGLMTLASAFFAPAIFKNVSEQAALFAKNLLFIFAISALFRTVTFMLVIGILRSGGDTTFCMVAESVIIWVFFVPLILLGGLVWNWNIYVLYSIIMCSEVVKTIVFFLRVRTDKWIRSV